MYWLAIRVVLGLGDRACGWEGRCVGWGGGELKLRHGWLER